jgi:hypothetical protein
VATKVTTSIALIKAAPRCERVLDGICGVLTVCSQ